MANASPAHWCSGGNTCTLCFVKPNTPSTTKLLERIDVADTESLFTREVQMRPCDSGLNDEPSTAGRIGADRSQLGRYPTRPLRFSFGPGANVNLPSSLWNVES